MKPSVEEPKSDSVVGVQLGRLGWLVACEKMLHRVACATRKEGESNSHFVRRLQSMARQPLTYGQPPAED